jgi:hypothetical protein
MAKNISELKNIEAAPVDGAKLRADTAFLCYPTQKVADGEGIYDRNITFQQQEAYVRNVIANRGGALLEIDVPEADLAGLNIEATNLVAAINAVYNRERNILNGKAGDDDFVSVADELVELDGKLDTESLVKAILSEYARATGAEGDLAGDAFPEGSDDLTKAINNELSRATTTEGILTNLNEGLSRDNLVAAINSENERAEVVEGGLADLNDGLSQDNLVAAINNENERAKEAEVVLQNQMGDVPTEQTLIGRINALDNELSTEEAARKGTDGNLENLDSGITGTGRDNLVAAINFTYGEAATGDIDGSRIVSGSVAEDALDTDTQEKIDSAYQKPEDGIPDADLTEAVQQSLGNADSALQTVAVDPDGGIAGDGKETLLALSQAVIDELTALAGIPAATEANTYLTYDGEHYAWVSMA